jgi:citrate lyase synthetase
MESEKKSNILELKFKKATTFDIKIKDELDNSINLSKIDDLITQKSMVSHYVVQDESDINQYYRNMDIKIFKDIIFIENK